LRAIEELTGLLARLPGIGKKSAARIAFHLLRVDGSYAAALAERIEGIQSRVKLCPVCGSYAEDETCEACADPRRDRSTLCVVEQPQDVLTLEASREWRGLYHVLGGLISPLDGVGPERLRIGALVSRVRDEGVREVVLATNPTVEGDTTALYVKKALEGTGASVSRLATGIPVGGDLEYADRLTIARSFRHRTTL